MSPEVEKAHHLLSMLGPKSPEQVHRELFGAEEAAKKARVAEEAEQATKAIPTPEGDIDAYIAYILDENGSAMSDVIEFVKANQITSVSA